MSSINPKEFYDEITYNLDIMEHTILSGRAHDIDLGFIEIFANSIKELENTGFDKAKIHELNARLGVDADRICAAVEKVFSPVNADAVRPLVGKNQTLLSVASDMTPGFTKSGLNALDAHFSLKRVAGDGHCLFRAIGAGTLDYLEKLPPAEKEQFMTRLQAQVDSLQDEKLKALFNDIQEVRNMPKEDCLNTRKSSDLLVEFLRNLACASMRKSTNEVLAALMTDSYLANMRDMNKMEHGGEPELIALGDTLGLDLRVVDAVVVGKGQATANSYLKDIQANTVFLLNTPAHYDIVYPKA